VATGDPEAVFLFSALAARIADADDALALIERSVSGGYAAVHLLETSPVFTALRATPRFTAVVETARRRRAVAAAIFERHNGSTLLGLPPGGAN
jgi:hypothetical protein